MGAGVWWQRMRERSRSYGQSARVAEILRGTDEALARSYALGTPAEREAHVKKAAVYKANRDLYLEAARYPWRGKPAVTAVPPPPPPLKAQPFSDPAKNARYMAFLKANYPAQYKRVVARRPPAGD